MRRLALPTATLIAFTGLAVVVGQPQTAQADDAGYHTPTVQDCLATNPFPQSMALRARNAFFYAEREQDGSAQYYRGVGAENASAITQINTPGAAGTGGQLSAQTAAQLTGWGRENVVVASGASGGLPTLTIDQYLVGDPAQSPLYSTVAKSANLPSAGSVALAADNFRPSTPSEWLNTSNQYIDPDEVAVAWRSPETSGQETVNVQLFKATLGGSGATDLVPLGKRWTISGDYDRAGGSREAMLAVTSGDLDADGTPEVVLTYSWGSSHPVQNVAVLSVSDPANPDDTTLTTTASGAYAVGGDTLRQLQVQVGHFGAVDNDIVLESVADAGDDFQENTAENAYLRLVGLPHNDGARPARLNPSAAPVTLTDGDLRKYHTPASSRNATTMAIGVGDLDPTSASHADLSGYDAGSDEIVVAWSDHQAYPGSGPGPYSVPRQPTTTGISVIRVDANAQAFRWIYTKTLSYSDFTRAISVGVGDLDGDGDADIMFMYSQGAGKHNAAWYAFNGQGALGLVRTAVPPLTSDTGEPGPIVMADVGNLATRMVQRRGTDYPYTGIACRDTSVATLTDVADPAPAWGPALQQAFYGSTTIGNGDTSTSSNATTTTKKVGRSYTVSVGGGFDAKVLGAETTVEYEHGWERSDSITSGADSGVALSSTIENHGTMSAAKLAVVDYRCYYYDIVDRFGPTPRGQTRACVPIDKTKSPDSPDFFTPTPVIRTASSVPWESGKAPGVAVGGYAWVPFRDEFSNLALSVPSSSTTISGVAGVAGRATDSNKEPTLAGTVATSALQKNPWWQITLNRSEKIGLVRVFP